MITFNHLLPLTLADTTVLTVLEERPWLSIVELWIYPWHGRYLFNRKKLPVAKNIDCRDFRKSGYSIIAWKYIPRSTYYICPWPMSYPNTKARAASGLIGRKTYQWWYFLVSDMIWIQQEMNPGSVKLRT